MIFFLSECSLFKKKDATPTDPIAQLPPITQEGKNTFGCLVNGKPWMPEGKRNTFSNNYTMDVDPGFRGGFINIGVYKYSKDYDEAMALSIDSVPKYKENIYDLKCVNKFPYIDGGGVAFYNYKVGKEYLCEKDAKILYSKILLTRYDLQAGIISGTFEFTLAKPNDTIKVTNGRFDKKLN
jgi:hypothetical protein